jgi:tRNA 2-thiouridine synthesizing protein A
VNVNAPDPTPVVLAAVERGVGAACRGCGKPVCGHEVMMSFVLGFKGAPRCLSCLARGLSREPAEFCAEVRTRIDHHECWRAGWRRADELDRIGGDGRPACTLASVSMRAAASVAGKQEMASAKPTPRSGDSMSRGTAAPSRSDSEWDAGDLGCGDLVLELRVKLMAMKSGQVLKLTARDPGARHDLPAWCGLTGHALVQAEPPIYFIQRRKE